MKVTESSSHYENLEQMEVAELLQHINEEDHKVAPAVKAKLSAISALVEQIVPRMREGGRLFYIGAGTSGRLGILDASECPPTYGVPHDWVIGLSNNAFVTGRTCRGDKLRQHMNEAR